MVLSFSASKGMLWKQKIIHGLQTVLTSPDSSRFLAGDRAYSSSLFKKTHMLTRRKSSFVL